ncbi:MAG TPA: FAD-dependent oxidoreductase [Steroidobacteraceae bacterium]|jgi:3-phenylpropionate/trans-cinnamate dioxygenase ferredoxin reductase subunit|nr:FAD-dependent oxidoreductase [Steroidobacteraceae bacterium]
MISTILIIGAGQAGAQAIDTLRKEGFTGRVVLIGEEGELPYQRPPLSKKYLCGELATDRLPFRHRAFYDEHRIELRLGRKVVRLDAGAREVALDDGETLRYDRLMLCLGAGSRRLTCPGATLAGVHYLRGISDVPPLQAGLKAGARVVVIGGGYIGLEVAATSRKMGCEVTVLEMADRLMNRVVAPTVSQYFASEHAAHGIDIRCDMRVVRLEGRDRVEGVVCADGSTVAADRVVVGVGAVAVTDIAQDAGLAVDNGIQVDEHCRTSDASIFAAGDCTNHPSPHYRRRVRLESVDNAFEQAKTAALNLLGRETVHDKIPWFWSDQFDNKLLIVGLSQDHDTQILRGDPASRSFSICYLKGRELLALEAVNHLKDYITARKLIADRTPMDLDKLRNIDIPLKEAI